MWPLKHKTSYKDQFYEIEIYTSSESWINVCMDCYDRTIFGWDTTIWKSGNIAFKVAQIKFLAMHITNHKLSFDIFMVGNLQNISVIP